jgi:hypothetical protein
MTDVFDQKIHKLVAVVCDEARDDAGAHIHVSLEELVLDSLEIPLPKLPDMQPLLDRVTALEAQEKAQVENTSLEKSDLEPVLNALQSTLKFEPALLEFAKRQDASNHEIAALKAKTAALEQRIENLLKIMEVPL